MSPSKQSIFLYIFLQVTQFPDLVKKNYTFSLHLVGIFHEMYNMQLSDKYENILRYMCLNYDCLIIGMEDQYLGNWNNNETHILSVEMHVGIMDMHT